MTRAALYARVSTQGQVHADPWASLPRQVEDLRALAGRLGFSIALEEVEQASGAKADRPGWGRVLEAARRREIDVIMAVSFDRVTRSERIGDWEAVKAELRALGARLVTIKQGEIDLSGTADAETRSDFDAVLSKRERLVLRERTQAGKRRKAAAGGWIGQPAAHGYAVTFDPQTGERRFVIDEAEAAVVRAMFERFAAGESVASLVRWLNAEGHPRPQGVQRSEGTHWWHSTVCRMLKNPLYGGFVTLDGPAGPVRSTDFPAIVEPATWEAARLRLNAAAFRSPRGPNQARPLSGILRCLTCGGRMAFHGGSKPSPRTRRGQAPDLYQCFRGKLDPNPCPSRQHLNAAAAEAAVLDYLRARLPAHFGEGAFTTRAKTRQQRTTQAPERIEQAIARTTAKRSRLLDWILDDPDTRQEAGDAKLAELRDELARLEAELIEARRVTPVPTTAPLGDKFIRAALRLLERAQDDPSIRRKLFEATILQVYLVRTSKPHARPQKLAVERLQLLTGDWL